MSMEVLRTPVVIIPLCIKLSRTTAAVNKMSQVLHKCFENHWSVNSASHVLKHKREYNEENICNHLTLMVL